ncbi:MAG: valine--tRNA ligase [Myxococcales bacterium]
MAATATEAPTHAPELDKGYDPSTVESRWAAAWEERGLFHAQDVSDKPSFAIVLPPPNVTGSLHIGHALTATLQDILVRWKRMSGFNACWLPGTDHAGIATQMVVERELKKTEGKSRHDLGRAEFVRRVWAWKEQYGERISRQHRALGASLDWERERFTMDAQSSRAVREAFVRLFEEGLLYRAERMISWCVSDRTALSDLEVDHQEGAKSELYQFAYPLADGSGEIVVATTRPETMLGDTAVAVHPADPRYQHLIGKHIRHPLLDRTFPVIADAALVDPKFGTGAVKVTPGHSFEDFESGKRNGLPSINILNPDGTLNENAGPFQGRDRIEVRPALKAALRELGLERGAEPHTLSLGRCQRCGNVVEPLLSKQWFVKTEPLARDVIAAVEAGRIEFVPAQWRAEFFRWMRNLHDWCVSRQLWWGHQIPAWSCDQGHTTVAREAPAACATCGSRSLRQDDDVLDTWFSSGLWPFSTFGWPDRTPALASFYPNAVMETGFDILFFWVARMAMLGLHLLGEVPFRTVFLHAMVRDEKGEKMSKTRGNVIDPLDITAKYGADALRFTLAAMAAQGRDIKLSVERIAAHRSFANKIWNAARFILMHAEDYDPAAPAAPATVYDRWILSRMQRCAEATNAALGEFRFSDAALGVYRFVWGELCDWAIELSKPALFGEGSSPRLRAGAQSSLLRALDGALRLLHPFMPFVTEELWQRLPRSGGGNVSLMTARFPGADEALLDPAAESEMDLVARAIDGARSVRGEVNLPPNQRVPLVLVARDAAARKLFEKHKRAFEHLANAADVRIVEPGEAGARPRQAAVHVEPEVEVHLPLAGLIDFAEERRRVEKELGKIDADLAGIAKRLGNEGFVARAPREVVEKDRARAEELRGTREKLARHLARVTSPEGGMEENRPEDKHAANGSSAGQHAGGSSQPTDPPHTAAEGTSASGHPPEHGAGEGGEPAEHHGASELVDSAVRTVKSIARGLLTSDEPKPTSGEVAQARARVQARTQARAAKKPAARPAKAKMKAKAKAKAKPAAKAAARAKGKVAGRAKKAGRSVVRTAKKAARGAVKKLARGAAKAKAKARANAASRGKKGARGRKAKRG